MRALFAATLCLALAGCLQSAAPSYDEPPSATPAVHEPSPTLADPYAGQELREIKALSAEEIAGYQKGAGLGYAKPAELNSYPGPLHALEMADRLELTPEQRDALTRVRADMLALAVPLGERYLVVEGAIEQGFRDDSLDAEELKALLDESAAVEAQLRFVHLDAHLATKALLTPHQVALYDQARGYGTADHETHEHG